jgi:hypothetical protein
MHYVVNNEETELVVLQLYSDRAICTPFDRKTNKVTPFFYVMAIGQNPKMKLGLEMTGPLRMEYIIPEKKSLKDNVIQKE